MNTYTTRHRLQKFSKKKINRHLKILNCFKHQKTFVRICLGNDDRKTYINLYFNFHRTLT